MALLVTHRDNYINFFAILDEVDYNIKNGYVYMINNIKFEQPNCSSKKKLGLEMVPTIFFI